jgi:hypothetical protein
MEKSMKFLIIVAAVMVSAGIGMSDSILGVLGFVAMACAGTDLLARHYEAHQSAQA